MHALRVLAALAVALFANAEVYVTRPSAGATFTGGKPMTVEWIDDGTAPVLSDIGDVTVGLYTGHLKLVQSIMTVDVSKTHSFTFTPNPQAGPNSDQYYIAFISQTYKGYSPDFALTGMSGSFSSPIPSSLSSPTGTSSSTLTSASGTTTGTATGTTTGTVTSISGTSSSAIGTATAIPSVSSGVSSSLGGSSTLQTTATGASSSGLSSSKASTGFSSSSTRTASSTIATAVPTNAAVANGPATGFVWTLIAFLGFALF